MKNIHEKLEIATEILWLTYGFMFGGTNSNLGEIKKIDEKSSWSKIVSWFFNR